MGSFAPGVWSAAQWTHHGQHIAIVHEPGQSKYDLTCHRRNWYAGLAIWRTVEVVIAEGVFYIQPLDGSCDMGLRVYCSYNSSFARGSPLAIEVFLYALALLYIIYFVRCMRRLRQEIYQHYADPLLKLQVRDALTCCSFELIPS